MDEKDIKIEVAQWLYKNEKHSVVVPEVTVSNKYTNKFEEYVRADLLALNGGISIYEIKSEKDNTSRLPHQIYKYLQYANKVSVVIHEKFLKKLDIPNEVGIFVISGSSIEKLRDPQDREILVDSYLRYWWGVEFKKAFKGFAGASTLRQGQAEAKMKIEFTPQEIKALTVFRLKERYAKEARVIKELVLLKKYDELFPKRIIEKKIEVTPFLEIPFGILKGITQPTFI
jgi:hypothetical protein|nr:MAG TPA: DNA repair protein MmcB-like protein [Caudoviricetes sp.]